MLAQYKYPEVVVTANKAYIEDMTHTINENSQLLDGDAVSGRIVIARTKKTERIVGDRFASWVAICVDHDAFHPFVVWTVVARPDGWHAEQGDYFKTVDEAIVGYHKRGGGE